MLSPEPSPPLNVNIPNEAHSALAPFGEAIEEILVAQTRISVDRKTKR
jgi:hypothetical protein